MNDEQLVLKAEKVSKATMSVFVGIDQHQKLLALKESLYEDMKNAGIDRIKTPRFTVWVQKNPVAVSIMNETLIPEEYYIPQLPKLDKKQLKEDMKHGDIPGAELTQTKGLRIR